MKELLHFNYNNYTYYLLYNNGFSFAKECNNELNYNLTEEEKILIINVFYKLIPTKNIKNLGLLKHKGKEFKHYFDLGNKIHIFYNIDGSIPKKDELVSLFNLYNNQVPYLSYKDRRKKQKKNKFKRLMLIRNSVIITLCTIDMALLCTYLLKTNDIHHVDGITNIEEVTIPEYFDYNDFTIDDLIKYIEQNPNLSNEEKEFFKLQKPFFNDQLPYLDIGDVVDTWSHLDISYIREGYIEDENGTTLGSFVPWLENDKYIISLFYSSSDENNISTSDYGILRHETLHTGSSKTKLNSISIDRYFYEFLNKVMANEYNYYGTTEVDSLGYDYSYDFLDEIGYLMIELFDEETLRQYHATPDLNLLINNLQKIIPDEEMSYKLISKFNDLYIKIIENVNEHSITLENEIQELKKEIKVMIKSYYEKKNNISITNDLYVYFLYNQNECYEKIKEQISEVASIKNIKIVKHKVYFNKNLEPFPKLAIESSDPELEPLAIYEIIDDYLRLEDLPTFS